MSNEPVGEVIDVSGTGFEVSFNKMLTVGTLLYTHPADDTALLRQALEALEQVASAMPFPVARATITALRERLGEKT